MVVTTVSLNYAKRHLGSLITRVERGECFIITKNGVPAAALIPFEPEPLQENERAL